MPFRGRPSKGCETCRRRKIKCDLRQEGGCEKCAKSGWKCEGYRDLTSLMFHDESDRIIKKVHAGKTGGQIAHLTQPSLVSAGQAALFSTRAGLSREFRSPVLSTGAADDIEEVIYSPSSSFHSSPSDSAVSLIQDEILSQSPSSLELSMTLDELALGYFFDKYVFQYQDQRGLWDIEAGNGCLMSSIKALGTAGVTSRNGQRLIDNTEAQKHYFDAIQKTNAALQSPTELKKDSTLLAIIILGIFESVSGFQKNIDFWREHVNGAASLIQLRGTEQFKTQTGCRLFLQTCLNLILGCLSRRLPIPGHVRAMQKEAEKFIPDANDGVWRFHLASQKVADLNARLLPGNYPVFSHQAQSVVQDGLALWAELDSIIEDAPEHWRPRCVPACGPTVFADYYYAFEHYLVVQIICGIWCFQVMLVDILRKAHINMRTSGRRIPDEQLEQIHQKVGSVRQLQLNILAVIPQHLARVFEVTLSTPGSLEGARKGEGTAVKTDLKFRDLNPFRNAQREDHDMPFVRMTGGYQVQFALFTAGAADPPGGAIRLWVANVLRLLSQKMGLAQAAALAIQLEEGDDSGSGIPEDMWHCTLPP